MFELKVEDKDVLMAELQKPWQVQEKVMETDINALKWVEDLEQRVIAADLHLKVSRCRDPAVRGEHLQTGLLSHTTSSGSQSRSSTGRFRVADETVRVHVFIWA